MLLLLFAASVVSAQSDVVKFSAKIANRNSDSLVIYGPAKFIKVLRADKNGVFSDSFAVTAGPHQLFDGVEQTMLYLKNGYDLSLAMDAKQFDESIVYTGKGAAENNFLAQKSLTDEKFEESMPSYKTDEEFFAAADLNAKTLQSKLSGLDQDFNDLFRKMIVMEENQSIMMYKQAKKTQTLIGAASPQFDYENHKGGKTKLSDLAGKYVYIDNWATWCGPCRAEIPHLQKVEEKYKGKNIEFVSISVDVEKDHEKWKKFVTDKKLGGIQLIADKNWNSDFITAYAINSIPRFILIGPDGKVIDADAKRPSDPALEAQLDSLLK